MTIDELLKDKAIKPKEKTEAISKWILDKSLPVDELIAFIGKFGNKTIERQDKRVVITQKPKASEYKSQEKLLSGDGPIIQYRRIREDLKKQ